MRHMETWMGDDRSWKTGFVKEGSGLKNQLHDLRKKYVTKFVNISFNKNKDDTLKNLEKFHNMDPTLKVNLLKEVMKTKCLIGFD